MKNFKILVIGGTAAGTAAAAKAARINPGAEVILFEKSDTVSYGVCEIPFLIGGVIQDEKQLVIYSPQKLSQEKKITVKTLHQLEKIVPSKKKILVRDLNTGLLFEQKYDRLILATGASPKKLNIKGEECINVFNVRSHSDTNALLNYLNSEKPKSVTIIGGGFVGIEMAEAFRRRNMEVTIIHNKELPLNDFDYEIQQMVLDELKKNQINFVANAKTEAFIKSKSQRVEYVVTNKGTFETDFVIVAVGIVPNTEIFKSSRIRLGENNAIKVNNMQETNIEGVYAAGDCCEVKNIVTGKSAYIPLATVAVRSGWVAGENAAGGKAKFEGAIFSAAIKLFSLEIARAGLTEDEAKSLRYNYVKDFITADTKVPFMPENKKIFIKLIVDKTTKRILGAQLAGEEGVALRANTIGTAIQMKLTVYEFSKMDLLYFPMFSPLWDPLLVAANSIKKKL